MGVRWPSGRAPDSGAKGRGFNTYLGRVVFLSKDTFTPRKVLILPRKRWFRPNMTEKLFTWMLTGPDPELLLGGTESQRLEPSGGSREWGRGEYERGVKSPSHLGGSGASP